MNASHAASRIRSFVGLSADSTVFSVFTKTPCVGTDWYRNMIAPVPYGTKQPGGQRGPTVEVCGQNIAELDDDETSAFRARNIGFIFQSFSLVPVLTAYENVEYPLLLIGTPAAERRERTLAMLAAVGLADQAAQRPNE